jgi:4-hydroxy-3-methylbut-2-en-1-yl diphosphate reductase
MQVDIDTNSGFCFGVVYAIQMAEDELDYSGKLYCLGDIVHNNMEVDRLKKKGLEIINHEQLKDLKNCKVLIRAHGEPPQTYQTAIENNIELIDASCPVVLKLQHRVRQGYEESIEEKGQIVIYGLEGHAEVNGLKGQTDDSAIIVMNEDDLNKIDFSKPVKLFSQTTKSTKGFIHIKNEIEKRLLQQGSDANLMLEANDTLCRQVSNREPQLKEFAKKYDTIVFVSGKKSSNGKILYDVCKAQNNESYFISELNELNFEWLQNSKTVGICGATSTPMWLMEEVKEAIEKKFDTPVLAESL